MNIEELIADLLVEPTGADEFVGLSPAGRARPVYGGQFLGQALMAAAGTVESGRLPHSLHAYFVRSGSSHTPIRYRVERVRDGRNFSHRSVVGTQDDREVFRQVMSFQVPAEGLEHSNPFEVGPRTDPGRFRDYRDWVEELSDNVDHDWFTEAVPVELRLEDPPDPRPRRALSGDLRVWMRADEPIVTDDPMVHAAVLAWMSDKTVSDVTMYPHARSWTDADTNILSLDHAMWLFEPIRADEWVLFAHETPATRGGRGLARADLVALDGRRLGAIAQEALLLIPGG